MDYIEEFVKATYAVRDSVEKLDTPFMERISDSLEIIAKQMTIQNQLAMLRLLDGEPKYEQERMIKVLREITAGVSYLDLFK